MLCVASCAEDRSKRCRRCRKKMAMCTVCMAGNGRGCLRVYPESCNAPSVGNAHGLCRHLHEIVKGSNKAFCSQAQAMMTSMQAQKNLTQAERKFVRVETLPDLTRCRSHRLDHWRTTKRPSPTLLACWDVSPSTFQLLVSSPVGTTRV